MHLLKDWLIGEPVLDPIIALKLGRQGALDCKVRLWHHLHFVAVRFCPDPPTIAAAVKGRDVQSNSNGLVHLFKIGLMRRHLTHPLLSMFLIGLEHQVLTHFSIR